MQNTSEQLTEYQAKQVRDMVKIIAPSVVAKYNIIDMPEYVAKKVYRFATALVAEGDQLTKPNSENQSNP